MKIYATKLYPQTKLLLAPAGCKPGDRVFLTKHATLFDPKAACAQIDAKKDGNVWGICAPLLKSDDSAKVVFMDSSLSTPAGEIVAPIKNAIIK